jgi:hypothetical protein
MTMGKLIDLTGQRFGRLTVIRRYGTIRTEENIYPTWLCHCDCGTEKVVTGRYLRTGRTRSCGCIQRDRYRKAVET